MGKDACTVCLCDKRRYKTHAAIVPLLRLSACVFAHSRRLVQDARTQNKSSRACAAVTNTVEALTRFMLSSA